MNVDVAIIGGGITGLATAAWLEHDHGIDDVVILERDERPGGKVRTEIDDGHTLEWGPQGFLDNAPDTLDLASLAALDDDLVRADEASADRFILRHGVLRSVPLSPPAFLSSDILPVGGRLRVLMEPFARRRPPHDETVFDFARRRIGRQAAEILVDAMVTGVFAGDSRQLSLAATFPRMAAMEAEHGSLTRALVARMRQARRQGRRSGGPAGPGGTLSTFRRGMGQLPSALARRLGPRLRPCTTVRSVSRDGDGFAVEAEDGVVAARTAVVALPAAAAARVLTRVAPEARAPLTGIPSAPIAVVMASYADPSAFGRPLGGFGFLVPRTENLGILGTLFCHSTFPGQAPPNSQLLRTMVGGAREPEAARLGDEALVGRVRCALRRVFNRDPDPDRVWIVRWERGISQYTVGHLERVEAAERAAREAGLELAGSSYHGVSVNDCITQGRAAARRIAARVGG